ncbi:MAG: GNAT family N-acetyltransferase [Bacteroidales bacterium]|nr:GNAT family N-acetyltransferase [Bacteroidales bacterium]
MPPTQATLSDIPLIQHIADVAFRDTYKEILAPQQVEYMMDWMYSAESLERQMTAEGNTFFLAGTYGYASVRPDGTTPEGLPLYHLEKLYVLPSRQGRGIGRALFEKVRAFVAHEAGGRAVMELNVNRCNEALGFYRRLGMSIVRSGDFPIGEGFYMNDYIMRLFVG